ncbi:MAG: hydantoinase/oxoprolinase family protein [Candidatus Obscuribacterales bacterium]|nr:hydantoinase/oxoprolinase family protein [Candidatus Obscuribacterales bacterium]
MIKEAEKNVRNVRIGIDVGGTFTHAVAIDAGSMSLIGTVKVPTSHTAKEGVARGIVEALQLLLAKTDVDASEVGFIAHSTTQATNALLEGDVAPVGIIGMGRGPNALIARAVSNLGRIELARDKSLPTFHAFIDTKTPVDIEQVKQIVGSLKEKGAKAIAVSEAFSVDDESNEKAVVDVIRAMGVPCTAGHEVSQLYGYKVRTRTAVINASMLPKMIESADMTESSVREAGIKAPVMIMRSDGGVMDIEAMRKRPILTMLSGPAAGVAAAMMFLHISDGIFLEVGGTSTDISAISNGRARIRTAEIGGHRVYMHTLDVRTVGVAGGSLPRLKDGRLFDVGPRSAHIAGLAYSSFCKSPENLKIELASPAIGDPADYVCLLGETESESEEGAALSVTPTCAANLLGLVPENDCARGDLDSIKRAFDALSKHTGEPAPNLAEKILQLSSEKCIKVVKALIADHKLDPEMVTLIGGGGGAAAIVPYLASQMGLRHQLAVNADVISAIGVALALIREMVERQVVNPTNDDILRVRQEAHEAVQKMGADPATIEVQVEVDNRTSVVRATAVGASSLTGEQKGKQALSVEEKLEVAAESMRVKPEEVSVEFAGRFFSIYKSERLDARLMGLWRSQARSLRVLDQTGTIRLQFRNAVFASAKVSEAEAVLSELLEEHAEWGDAGKVIPNTVLLAGPRIVDLSGLIDPAQVATLARAELETLPADADVVAIARLG